MYGDTEVIRRRLTQLREQAGDVRALADTLVARTESAGWSGRAAKSMWLRVTERAAQLQEVAAEHDRAADALDAHLRAVEATTETIAARQRRAELLVGDARARVAAIGPPEGSVAGPSLRGEPVLRPDPDDLALIAFEAPAPGHLDWLSAELPGLPAVGA